MKTRTMILIGMVLLAGPAPGWSQTLLPGFLKTDVFEEQVRWSRLEHGVRVMVDAPAALDRRPRWLVVYATPNGSTIEQTLGCSAKGLDWRYDIQHVGGQIRRLREIDTERQILLAVVQAPKLSWPTFRRENPQADSAIHRLVTGLAAEVAAERVVLACHSGGGSFVFGILNAVKAVPDGVERIVFLDANYSYSDDEHHGDKLLKWLGGDAARRLIVVAYDDREIVLNGKKVVGPDGGTFRASRRMMDRFRNDVELTKRMNGLFQQTSGLNGQIEFLIHPNPDNKILHTALVGEMNGLLYGLTRGTERESTWGTLGGPRAYTKWIQPTLFVDSTVVRATIPSDAPEVRLAFPPRPADAPTGSVFQRQIADLPRDQREAAVLKELVAGNIPEFLRRLIPIRVDIPDDGDQKHVATYHVMCDYLAVGTDADFFRVPITPASAVALADKVDASLITAKVSDDIFSAAQWKLDPKPLTQDRDAVATFWLHHQLIEEQLHSRPRGGLVAGIKKDVVWTNRLREKPHKVAIYGWHYPDGRPIQPLYVGHVDWYVDYSHGVRLMSQQIIVDGQAKRVPDVLNDPTLHRLLSTEGSMDVAAVRKAAVWEPSP